MQNDRFQADINTPDLPPAASSLGYQAHLAAVEFALTNAIIIRDRSDIQSARHWSELLEPFEHQVQNLITFCRRTPAALIADDVGLGKTISAGLILSELRTRSRVGRALVVAPKILLKQWRSELKTKFRIESQYASGRALRDLLSSDERVVITTYHTARLHMGLIREHDFDLAIFDEAHKLKSLFGQRQAARWATEIRAALGDSIFKYALFLTATPIQNSPWDLYSLIDCVAATGRHDNPFGQPDSFRRTFLAPSRRRFAPATLAPHAKDRFREIVSRYTMRVSRRTSRLPFPKRIVELGRTQPTEVEQRLLSLLVQDLGKLNSLEQASMAVAMMSSPAAFAHQLTRRASNRRDLERSARLARSIAEVNPIGAKGASLRTLVDNLRAEAGQGFRCIVFTTRRETQQALAEMLRANGVRVGLIRGGHATENQATIDAFNQSAPGVNVIVSTDAGAEGVNLQVANIVVNYDLPWNPMVVEQRIGRVQRLGSTFENVIVYNLVVADSIEEKIVTRLLHKLQTITDALGDIEGIIEAAGGQTEYDVESRIQHLVLQALRGQDTEEAARRIEAEIEAAKDLYEREREMVSQTLGSDLDAIHRAGPTPPDIEPITPRMDIRTFVRSGHEADGALVEEESHRRLRVRYPGQPAFIATFDPDDPDLRRTGSFTQAAGANLQLFVEGSRPFEQLVGNWAARRSHVTQDRRNEAGTSPMAAARNWLSQFGSDVEYEGMRVTHREPVFNGTLTVKATASTRHDRIERLIEVPIGKPPPHATEDVYGELYSERLSPDDIAPDSSQRIQDAIATATDIRSFAEFYERRRDEEARKIQSLAVKRLVEQDFTPSLAGDLQAATGMMVDKIHAEVRFTVDGNGPYSTEMTIDAGTLAETPDTERCSITARRFPSGALDSCEMTGDKALRHLLVTSTKSGRRAFPALTTHCAVTGGVLLKDEVLTSIVSEITADQDLFSKCAITGQAALATELAVCAFTRALVLPEEVVQSEISGKPARGDQIVSSGVSGRRGHKSEFITCSKTGDWILAAESAASDVTGAIVRSDLLVSSEKNPQRRGLANETVRCAVSGRLVLRDETEASEVSGRRADRDLMARSDSSARSALPAELVRCEVTSQMLLPDETSVCAETGKRVHTSHLAKNDITGQTMLLDVLSVCPETGHRGRATDFATCAVTGYLVDPAVTTMCTQTNKRVLERLTIRCAACENPLLRTDAVMTSDGGYTHPNHAVTCTWTDEVRIQSDLPRCKLTGAHFVPSLIEEGGTTVVQSHLLRAIANGVSHDAEAVELVREGFAQRGIKVARVWCTRSSESDTIAVIAEERGFLGLRKRYFIAYHSRRRSAFIGEPSAVQLR